MEQEENDNDVDDIKLGEVIEDKSPKSDIETKKLLE